MLSSCQPRGGCVRSVTVYPSDFGMERMSREDVEGPAELVQGEETEEVGRIVCYNMHQNMKFRQGVYRNLLLQQYNLLCKSYL